MLDCICHTHVDKVSKYLHQIFAIDATSRELTIRDDKVFFKVLDNWQFKSDWTFLIDMAYVIVSLCPSV